MKAEAIIGPDVSGVIPTINPRLAMAYVMRAFADVEVGVPDVPFYVLDGYECGHVRVGRNCVIWPGVTIGGDGFCFDLDTRTGEVVKFPHMGKVVIGDNVEIQAGTCIARGSLLDTVIEDNVKIDQLCHIAHNCHIGKYAALAAGVILGGSVTIGERVWMGLRSTVNDGLTVGDGAIVGTGAVVLKDVPEHAVVVGNPAKAILRRDSYKFNYNQPGEM